MTPRFDPRIERLPNFLKVFGPVSGLLRYCRVYLVPQNGRLFSLNLGETQLWLRRTLGDISIFFQIFVKREYETRQWPQNKKLGDRYKAILASGHVPVIVDAGANIGLSALWFAARYPEAKIYAVEPDDANKDMLTRNVAGNPMIVPLHGAIWDRPSRLKIENPEAGSASFRVIEGEGSLRAFSVPEILAMEERGELFIVKIDIEGGEASLFRSNTGWVKDPALIVIELHDWKYPGDGTSQTFLQTIASASVDFLAWGENFFCFKAG
jgi:FkbM family methyltransferase